MISRQPDRRISAPWPRMFVRNVRCPPVAGQQCLHGRAARCQKATIIPCASNRVSFLEVCTICEMKGCQQKDSLPKARLGLVCRWHHPLPRRLLLQSVAPQHSLVDCFVRTPPDLDSLHGASLACYCHPAKAMLKLLHGV
jgi:hypothetical protein